MFLHFICQKVHNSIWHIQEVCQTCAPPISYWYNMLSINSKNHILNDTHIFFYICVINQIYIRHVVIGVINWMYIRHVISYYQSLIYHVGHKHWSCHIGGYHQFCWYMCHKSEVISDMLYANTNHKYNMLVINIDHVLFWETVNFVDICVINQMYIRHIISYYLSLI